MNIILTVTVYLLAALMLIIIGITIYKNWMHKKRQKALQKNTDYLRKHEKELRQKGLKKFTFWVKNEKEKKIPRHVWAADYKTANQMHQEDLRTGNI